MKKLIAIFTLVLGVMAAKAALPQPDLIAQIHFAGAQKISLDSSYLLFANEFSCAEAQALANQTFDKLAHAPHDWFKGKIAANRGDGTAQLRPLFDDLLASEWYFEARDMPTGSPEYALAIHLNSNRAQLWKNNLQVLLEKWTGIPARKVPGGWELKKDLPPNLIRVTESDESDGWLLVDCGQNQLSLGGKIFQWLAQDANSGSPWASGEKKWLFADVNWVRLAQWFPELKELNLPETKLGVSAKGKNLHIDGKFIFPENFSSNLPPWRIPANTINQPFVSFTAARGFAPWLNTQAWARPFEISPALDQIFMWAMPKIPFETFAAFPVLNSADALAQSYTRLNLALISADNQNEFLAPFRLAMINNEIQFQGLPFIAPHLQAVHDPAGQFLLAGGFANPPHSAPLPQDLIKMMATKNLVFYHWEITAERFPQLLNMTQLGLVLTRRQQLGATSAAMKWLQKVTPNLGNTATEVFRTAPNELTFTRSAPGGLTALEFLVLGNWLEANNFPDCNLKLPPDQMTGNPVPRPIRTINTPAPAH
jgi:hypothetical protein